MNLRPQPRKGFSAGRAAFGGDLPIDWEKFREWLLPRYEQRTAMRRLSYARTFAGWLLDGDFSGLQLLSDDKRSHVMKALSALAKFLGVYDYFKALVRNYGVKWAGRPSEDLLIERLTRPADEGDLARWVRDLKGALPELSTILDLVASTGLRFEEAIEAYNLIIALAEQGSLSAYYNPENQALEHFRFRELFIRRGKKAFLSFVSEGLVQKIAAGSRLTRNAINGKLKRRKLRARFSDLREYYASIMTRQLRQPEIDFLQGRVSTSVFMRNYFNPAWISDLKSRALQGAEELLTTLNPQP